MAEATYECLKAVLTKVEANWTKMEADLASKREMREVDVAKAKEELTKVEKRVEEKTVGKYKASMDLSYK